MPERIIPGVWLPAENLDRMGNEGLPTHPYPFDNTTLQSLQNMAPWATMRSYTSPTSVKTHPVMMLQPSEHHARSFVMPLSALAGRHSFPDGEPRLVWQDEHGNPFSSVSYKGNIADELTVHTDTSDPRGVRFNGLQTTYAIQRCIAASRILRKAGVDTEHITGVYVPVTMPYEGKLTDPRAVKRTLLVRAMLQNAEHNDYDEADMAGKSFQFIDRPGISDTDFNAIKLALQESAFVVTSRSMLTSDRLADLEAQDGHTARAMLDRAIWLSTTLRRFTPDPGSAKSAYEQYLGDFLPRQISTNIARIHNAGLTHRMIHSGNVLSTGGIVDLDSVIGPGIGLEERDTNLTANDYLRDFSMQLRNVNSTAPIPNLFAKLTSNGVLPTGNNAYHDYLRNLYSGYFAARDSRTPSLLDHRELLYLFASAHISGSEEMENRQNFQRMERRWVNGIVDRSDELQLTTQVSSGSYARFASSFDTMLNINEYLANIFLDDPEGPLVAFNENFGDITTREERLETAKRYVTTQLGFDRQNSDGAIKYTDVISAYKEYAKNQPRLNKSLNIPTEHICGRNIAIQHTPSIEASLAAVRQLGIAPKQIVLEQRVNFDPADGKWNPQNDLQHAPLLFTNVDAQDVATKLRALHSARIHVGATRLAVNRQNERLAQRPIDPNGIIGSVQRIAPSEVYMPFRFESDQFLVFVSRADDVTTLHIESAADEKAMRKILADFGLSHLPIEARADKPFNNAMEAFIADSSDLSDV